jgi:ubiquinone/menaquinone biosynthesis C-methylase UbiE
MFERFATRSHKLERLDTGEYTPGEYAKWLKEARLINRWLGDVRALRLTLQDEAWISKAASISILDIGAGSGELLKAAKELVGPRKTFLVGAEMSAAAARNIARRNQEFGAVALQCDGTELPFDDDSFDVVMCSLLLHHLSDTQAERLIGEMQRVAKRQFIVIDLHRSPLPFYLYRTFAPIFLQRLTVEDGSLSILRSLRVEELRELAAKAGVGNAEIKRAAFRLILTGSKTR